jgi:hypothetical protein
MTLIVGAPDEDSNATGMNGTQTDNTATSSGAVYSFKRTGTAWPQKSYIKATNSGAGDQFGFSVAVSDVETGTTSVPPSQTLVIGAPFEDESTPAGINRGNLSTNSNATSNSGAAYLH